jgi:uncharacterized protein YqgC (DUF456 family)
MKFSSFNQNFSWNWIIIFAAATAVASVLDYIFQIWGTKKFGGTKAGIIGSIVGIIVGIFFMPFGIIVCPFLGAFIGEIIVGRSSKQSLKAALGTFVGFMFGTGLKLLLCVWILIYFILNLLK